METKKPGIDQNSRSSRNASHAAKIGVKPRESVRLLSRRLARARLRGALHIEHREPDHPSIGTQISKPPRPVMGLNSRP